MLRKWHGNHWAILVALSLGYFMTLLDLTIVNVAIPQMTSDLDASLDQVLWVVNAYALGLAVLMITAGRIGDLRGKKLIFIIGVALFTLASLACGLAQDPMQLIAFRGAQGIGAALLMPQTLSIIADVFPAEKRGVALGVWGAVAGLSGIVGPILGGVLVTHLDWRWIFFINIPVGVLVLIMSLIVMPSTQRTAKQRLDVTGVVLASAALFCLAFALTEGERYDWNGWVWSLIGLSCLLMVAFLVYERGQQHNDPLLPYSLFRDRGFSLVNFVGFAVSFGVIGLFLPVTIYLQSVLGFSALKTGLVMLPMAIGGAILAGPAGVLSEKIGGKYILITGLLAFSSGMTWIATIAEPDSSATAFLAPMFLIGLGAGCTFIPMASEVMRHVPQRLNGAASGVNNALRQVGSVMAAAVIGAVLQAQLTSSMTDQAREHAAQVPEAYRDGFVGGFTEAGAEGLEVGVGSGGAEQLPDGVPADVAQELQSAGDQVFADGFIDAMAPTMLVSVGVLIIGALACLALRTYTGAVPNAHGLPLSEEEPEAVPVPARD